MKIDTRSQSRDEQGENGISQRPFKAQKTKILQSVKDCQSTEKPKGSKGCFAFILARNLQAMGRSMLSDGSS